MLYKKHSPEQIDQMILDLLSDRTRTMREVIDDFLKVHNISSAVARVGIWRLINNKQIEVIEATYIRIKNPV